eukprot:TRINITY_DN9954_c0_g1_i1.p3 TRINITY_DN9954_c0_g1~~TRINITY_DN9954_c0_g1_i1.p3  ORF type:complete len:102 (+),score=17.08 TRINITY_DN9954_c0_g1_i1:296-601(+)
MPALISILRPHPILHNLNLMQHSSSPIHSKPILHHLNHTLHNLNPILHNLHHILRHPNFLPYINHTLRLDFIPHHPNLILPTLHLVKPPLPTRLLRSPMLR